MCAAQENGACVHNTSISTQRTKYSSTFLRLLIHLWSLVWYIREGKLNQLFLRYDPLKSCPFSYCFSSFSFHTLVNQICSKMCLTSLLMCAKFPIAVFVSKMGRVCINCFFTKMTPICFGKTTYHKKLEIGK